MKGHPKKPRSPVRLPSCAFLKDAAQGPSPRAAPSPAPSGFGHQLSVALNVALPSLHAFLAYQGMHLFLKIQRAGRILFVGPALRERWPLATLGVFVGAVGQLCILARTKTWRQDAWPTSSAGKGRNPIPKCFTLGDSILNINVLQVSPRTGAIVGQERTVAAPIQFVARSMLCHDGRMLFLEPNPAQPKTHPV